MEIIQNYLNSLSKIFSSPRNFFRVDFKQLTLGHSMAFGLLAHWLGKAFEHLVSQLYGANGVAWNQWLSLIDSESVDSLGRNHWYQNAEAVFKSWMTGVSVVLLDPFYTLASTAVGSLFIFVAARLFISPNAKTNYLPVQYSDLFRVLIVALTPYLFLGIPGLGPIISAIWTLILTVIGIEEVFGATRGRAIVIAIFPKLLLIACATALLLLILGGIFAAFLN